MPDTYDAVMAGCRLLLERMNLSNVELAQFLRCAADVLELEEIYTDKHAAALLALEIRERFLQMMRDKAEED